MSDEKLSGGGRPESRAEFEQWRSHYFSAGISFETWPKAVEDAYLAGRQAGERDMVERAAQALENRFHKCPHCGTVLKPWTPAISGIVRLQTNHKWCTGCKCVTYEDLLALAGVPAEPGA